MKCEPFKFVASLFLLALSAAPVAAHEVEPSYPELPNFHIVNARLYRGAQPQEGGIRRLKGLGVKTIINLRDADETAAHERAEAVAAGMKYFNVPLPNWCRPRDADVLEILRLINDPSNGVVFVHCKRGKDRTGTVIACYRILDEKWASSCAKREAKHYGMSPFQWRMKGFIRSFYERHGEPHATGIRQTSCPIALIPDAIAAHDAAAA